LTAVHAGVSLTDGRTRPDWEARQMINVTDRAKHQLKRLVERLGESRRRPRLVGRQGAFGLVSDERRPGDQLVEDKGTVILLIGREISEIVANSMIDCEETGGQARLIVRRAA
jgi:Fe-S cluster assembly iron-binding protein IscA